MNHEDEDDEDDIDDEFENVEQEDINDTIANLVKAKHLEQYTDEKGEFLFSITDKGFLFKSFVDTGEHIFKGSPFELVFDGLIEAFEEYISKEK